MTQAQKTLTDAMVIDWANGTNLVRRTAARIARDLAHARTLDQVPSATALAAQYGVSMTTAGDARKLLAAYGLLRKDGKFFYVTAGIGSRTRRPLRM